jgi:hypothetical protein
MTDCFYVIARSPPAYGGVDDVAILYLAPQFIAGFSYRKIVNARYPELLLGCC